MNKYLLLLLVFSVAFSQNKKVSSSENKIYSQSELDEKANYPEGTELLYAYINHYYKNPEELGKNNITACFVVISFTIEKDGTSSNVKTIKSCGFGSDEEAIRVIRTIKRWKPGKIKNKTVRSSYLIPIHLRNLE
ncbi:MAG: energy transducer TonB [Flavobacterium sp.]|uniref:energy transducer TonB n=1 Tax=Flavobacterium sp. TaxID=239 RepID=UPI003262CD85